MKDKAKSQSRFWFLRSAQRRADKRAGTPLQRYLAGQTAFAKRIPLGVV
jgi:hypothetical protein